MALRAQVTEETGATLVATVASATEHLTVLLRKRQAELAYIVYLSERILALAVLLSSRRNERTVEMELS
jgi:hypothetical protein